MRWFVVIDEVWNTSEMIAEEAIEPIVAAPWQEHLLLRCLAPSNIPGPIAARAVS
jgi:hypothetical protein